MKLFSRSAPFLALALLTGLAGCTTPSAVLVRHNSEPYSATNTAQPDSAGNGVSGEQNTTDINKPVRSTITPGTGQMINEQVASAKAPEISTTGEATFNFEGESLQAVVKAVLGDLLQQNYVIAPNVQGTVTLGTPKPVSPSQALSLLEMVLAWNNARLIWSDGRYNVVAADQALPGNLAPRTGSPSDARGYEVRAVPLKFISASEMEKLLKPYARDRAVVQIDASRNLIVLAGTSTELQNYLRTIEIFDVDWLAGMSVGIFPLQSSEASKVVTELEKIFGDNGKTPISGMFRFMPLEGQNTVMVITPQASYLTQVESWIERMDAGGEGSRLYVYDVQFVKAVELAEQLGSVFGKASSPRASKPASLMPSLEPVEVQTTGSTPSSSSSSTSSATTSKSMGGNGSSSTTLNIDGGEVGISAVEESNALLVRASPGQWESIRRAIERLDTMPLQAHIEAQVVEVKLTGELSYGVSWFFGNAIPSPTHAITEVVEDWRNDATSIESRTAKGGGGQWTFLGTSALAILNTLDAVSDLRILSAPSLLVRNNVEADFNAGTQIPVASTVINNNGNTNTDNTVSQVQFRQTGVSLKVKPRISANGLVFMEITQDVSSPSAQGPTIGGNISVDNRKLHTEVVVRSGETIVLAGLIKTEAGKGSSGIPYLSRIPVLGGLFGAQNQTNNREEVIVLITPTIIRDPNEARQLTDEYGKRFQALEPLRKAAQKSETH